MFEGSCAGKMSNHLYRTRSSSQWSYLMGIIAYTFFLLLAQAHLFSRLPYPAMRADLLLPAIFGAAVEWPPVAGLLWAVFWGFVMDAYSGEFWGFHVGSYVVTTCLVHTAYEKFDFQNPLYQMCFVGLCALGQSVALGLYISLGHYGVTWLASTWISLLIRSLLTMLLTPFVLYPIWRMREKSS